MREEEDAGLGLFQLLTNKIFGDYRFVASDYRPLQAWPAYSDQIHEWQIQKYGSCIKMALEGYGKSKSFSDFPASIFSAMNAFKDIVRDQSNLLNKLSYEEAFSSEAYRVLSAIDMLMSALIETVEKFERDIPEYPLPVRQEYDLFKDNLIFGALARGIYNFLEGLAIIHSHDRIAYGFGDSLFNDIYPVDEKFLTRTRREIASRLAYGLQNKVEHNLDPARCRYPLVTRLLLNFLGVSEHVGTDQSSTRAALRTWFVSQLKSRYLGLLTNAPEFARKLLPEGITCDLINKELRQTTLRGTSITLKLDDISAKK